MITLLVVIAVGITVALVASYVMYKIFKDDKNV
jgi:hypothetical protein